MCWSFEFFFRMEQLQTLQQFRIRRHASEPESYFKTQNGSRNPGHGSRKFKIGSNNKIINGIPASDGSIPTHMSLVVFWTRTGSGRARIRVWRYCCYVRGPWLQLANTSCSLIHNRHPVGSCEECHVSSIMCEPAVVAGNDHLDDLASCPVEKILCQRVQSCDWYCGWLQGSISTSVLAMALTMCAIVLHY